MSFLKFIIYRRNIVTETANRLGLLQTPSLSVNYVRSMSTATQQKFEEAKKKLDSLKEDPGNAAKLKIYALYKQATTGKCNIAKPSMVDFVGRAKWDAWNSLGDLSPEDAQQEYVNLIESLVQKGGDAGESEQKSTSLGGDESIRYTKEDGIATILLNRPKRKNALDMKMYGEISRALSDAANDDKIVFAVVTGAGDYFCSGNDLSNFLKESTGDIAADCKKAAEILKKYVASYIDFPKPLVGLINGPAIGIAVTVLGLFDIVYASNQATFHTPFSSLAQAPEACSSYTFPLIMGPAKSNEVLMLGRKLNADEACSRGLITEVFPHHSFHQETSKRLAEMKKFPSRTLNYCKEVSRNIQKEILHKVNEQECTNLEERWASEDCMNVLMEFLNRKSKI